IGSMPCAAIAARSPGSSRRARIPPWIFGCSVFTRPPIISSEPVYSATSVTGRPAARSARQVPPLDNSAKPRRNRPPANSTIPVLSYTDSSARRVIAASLPAPLEVALDECIEVAVEDALHVGSLDVGAQILDQLVRLQDVAADLVAPADRAAVVELGEVLHPLGLLHLVELGLEGVHRRRAVLVLAPLLLAGDHDARRDVGDPDRRLGLVDVLAAGAARPERVDAQVLVLDLDLDVVVEFGQHFYRGE